MSALAVSLLSLLRSNCTRSNRTAHRASRLWRDIIQYSMLGYTAVIDVRHSLNSQRGIIVVETAKKRLRWVGFLHLISNAALIITRWQLLTRWPHIDKNKRLFSCYYPYKFVFSDSLLLCLCCAITVKFVSIYCAKSGKSFNHVAD